MEKPRSFLLRHDIFTHPRTAWMRPDDLAIFAAIASASLLGVSTYSPRKLGRLTKVQVEGVPSVLHALEERRLIRWWPDDEIAWVVELADEGGIGGSLWLPAQREWREYPPHVREAIADRYPILLSSLDGKGRPIDPPCPPPVNAEPGPPDPAGAATPSVAVAVAVGVEVDPYHRVAAFRARWAWRLAALKSELGPLSDPTRDPQAYAGLCEALEQHGEDLVHQVVEWAVRNEPKARSATMFRGAAFGAHLDRYLESAKSERGRAMVAPATVDGRSLTDAEAREWIRVASGGGDPKAALRGAWEAEEATAARVAEEVWS